MTPKSKARIISIILHTAIITACFVGGYYSEGCWETTELNNYSREREWSISCLKDGNIAAYEKLKTATDFLEYPEEILFYSIVMALKYNYVPANYDVYNCLHSYYKKWPHFGDMDSETKRVSLYFLGRAEKLGNR